jgi:hypothetical protein
MKQQDKKEEQEIKETPVIKMDNKELALLKKETPKKKRA